MNPSSYKVYVSKRKLQRYKEERGKKPVQPKKLGQSLQKIEDLKIQEESKIEENKKQKRESKDSSKFVRDRSLSLCDVASDEEVSDITL